jgi:hypothetical protein
VLLAGAGGGRRLQGIWGDIVSGVDEVGGDVGGAVESLAPYAGDAGCVIEDLGMAGEHVVMHQ